MKVREQGIFFFGPVTVEHSQKKKRGRDIESLPNDFIVFLTLASSTVHTETLLAFVANYSEIFFVRKVVEGEKKKREWEKRESERRKGNVS